MEKEKKSDVCTKFMVSMKTSLFERVEKYAYELGVNRSAFIALCCSQYINAQEGMVQMQKMVDVMNALNDKQELSSDDVKKIDEMNTFVEVLKDGFK